jgi:hypothetical protein
MTAEQPSGPEREARLRQLYMEVFGLECDDARGYYDCNDE